MDSLVQSLLHPQDFFYPLDLNHLTIASLSIQTLLHPQDFFYPLDFHHPTAALHTLSTPTNHFPWVSQSPFINQTPPHHPQHYFYPMDFHHPPAAPHYHSPTTPHVETLDTHPKPHHFSQPSPLPSTLTQQSTTSAFLASDSFPINKIQKQDNGPNVLSETSLAVPGTPPKMEVSFESLHPKATTSPEPRSCINITTQVKKTAIPATRSSPLPKLPPPSPSKPPPSQSFATPPTVTRGFTAQKRLVPQRHCEPPSRYGRSRGYNFCLHRCEWDSLPVSINTFVFDPGGALVHHVSPAASSPPSLTAASPSSTPSASSSSGSSQSTSFFFRRRRRRRPPRTTLHALRSVPLPRFRHPRRRRRSLRPPHIKTLYLRRRRRKKRRRRNLVPIWSTMLRFGLPKGVLCAAPGDFI